MYFATLNCTVPESISLIHDGMAAIYYLKLYHYNQIREKNGDLHKPTLQSKDEEDHRYSIIFLLRELKKSQAK